MFDLNKTVEYFGEKYKIIFIELMPDDEVVSIDIKNDKKTMCLKKENFKDLKVS